MFKFIKYITLYMYVWNVSYFFITCYIAPNWISPCCLIVLYIITKIFHTNSPKLYSNDIRHQYVSALYARNFGEEKAKWLGDINEQLHFGTGYGTYDTELDKLNNEIGRNYARQYPNISKEELLQILLKDWEKNSNYTKNILKNTNKK